MSLEKILEQSGVTSMIYTLVDILENGILDYVAHSYTDQDEGKVEQNIFVGGELREQDEDPDEDEPAQFLHLAKKVKIADD